MSESPVRILHVVGRMNRGGAESFIMNVYRNIDRNRVQFDFAVNTHEESHYDSEIRSLGGRVLPHTPPIQTGISSYCRLFENTLIKFGPFAGVHSHVQSFSGALLQTAAKSGVKIRIAHSHNTSDGRSVSFPRQMYRWYMKRLIFRYATQFFFCSNEAGLSLFGDKILSETRAKLIRNVIEPDKFSHKIPTNNIRTQLMVNQNVKLICHTGRFDQVKNHKFLLRIFACFLEVQPESFLVMIGDGPLRVEVEILAKQLGIAGKTVFLGIRGDVPDLLRSMDLFFFPSLYEGQPLALVEAQVAGLPCIASDTISEETDIKVGLVSFISLNSSETEWVKALQSALNITIPDYSTRTSALCSAGFDLHKVVASLEEIYCG